MKKKIYICLSILIVFILSLSIVRANTMDTYGMSLKEMEMMEEYKKGNINTDEFIELRKAKAGEYGLLDYCDSTYFLSEDFYDNYSDAYLIKNGLMILDRYSAGFETGSLTLAHSQNSQMSFMYGFFFVKFLFFTVVCVVIVV